MKEYEIDGARFSTLDEFYDEIERVFKPEYWERGLAGFSGLLRSGSRRPKDGCIFRWKNHELSKARLGYAETIRELEKSPTGEMIAKMKTVARERRLRNLETARQGTGDTIFDWIVEIIRDHGEGGGHEWDNVKLVLE